jgi:hypothetical protein
VAEDTENETHRPEISGEGSAFAFAETRGECAESSRPAKILMFGSTEENKNQSQNRRTLRWPRALRGPLPRRPERGSADCSPSSGREIESRVAIFSYAAQRNTSGRKGKVKTGEPRKGGERQGLLSQWVVRGKTGLPLYRYRGASVAMGRPR